jgi:hypothetical protein
MSKYVTVHRGMFHSIPAMLIAGLVTFLTYQHPVFELRVFLGVGVMLGFLSHLVLDEVSGVDFRGLAPELHKYAGTSVKLQSTSWLANVFSYSLMLALGYQAYLQYQPQRARAAGTQAAAQRPLTFSERALEKLPLQWQPAPQSPPAAVAARQ